MNLNQSKRKKQKAQKIIGVGRLLGGFYSITRRQLRRPGPTREPKWLMAAGACFTNDMVM
jgi:hypothetical protein